MTYGPAFRAVRSLINSHDPEGLLADGAPEDEYDPETADLAALVLGREEITGDSVSALWLRWFGSPSRPTRSSAEVALVAAELNALRRDLRHPGPASS